MFENDHLTSVLNSNLLCDAYTRLVHVWNWTTNNFERWPV